MTLTSNLSVQTRTKGSTTILYTQAIVATGNDTTSTADSATISNIEGDIKDIWAGVKATNQTGTSPTLAVSLLGSFDDATWFAITTQQADTAGTTGTMTSPTLSISTASTTNVSTGVGTSSFRPAGGMLPPYIRMRVTVGGSSTPGWTGTGYIMVKR